MADAPTKPVQTISLDRPTTGPFSAGLYRDALAQVHEQRAVLSLTVSNGQDERVFFFTRGAILFLATGTTGGEVLARKIVARGLLPQAKVDALVKRANSDTPLLQDLLQQDGLLPADTIKALVEEVLEDHLVEVAFWDGLYELNPGNPPPRIYAKEVPAVRLSLGLNALLERVRPKVQDAPAILASLGGSTRNTIRRGGPPPARPSAPEQAVLALVRDDPRSVREVLEDAAHAGTPVQVAAAALASLARSHTLVVEKVRAERTRAEDAAQARAIEAGFEQFVNHLLARTHLAAIYERLEEAEKAAEQHRGIADEHLRRDNVNGGLASLRQVLRFRPHDLEAREVLVKVLQQANRAGEAAREAVELGRLLITVGLPGRARHAFELALKLVPGSMNVLWMLGGLLAALGYPEDATRIYEEIAERAEAAGDQPAAVAAYQQILAIDPLNLKALRAVRKYGGYGRALVARYTTAIISVLVLAATLALGGYETLALEAYRHTRDDEVWPYVDAHKFDPAREAVEAHARKWDWAWTARVLDPRLRDRIDEEESSWSEQGFAADVRAARKLDERGDLPRALERWHHARDTKDPDRKATVERAIAADERRVRKAEEGLVQARKLLGRNAPQSAHEVLVQTLTDAPWLLGSDVKIPCRIDSVPRGARVFVDGLPQLDRTPVVIERKPTPGVLVFDATGREPLKQPIEALPPWPFTAFLPRKPAWRASGVTASSAPLVAGDLVLAAGTDRNVVALDRASGAPRWTRSLGLFGESDFPPALVGTDAVAVRTSSGEVVLLELATGRVRWRRPVVQPPADAVDPLAARPVGCATGVLVREGARGLALLGAADGKPLWTATARGDVVGAPAVSGELVALALERQVVAFALADGSSPWSARLARPAITNVAAAPGNAFAIVLEPDDVARITAVGSVQWTEREVTGARASAPLVGGPLRVVVGGNNGQLAAVNGQGKVEWRATAEPDRALRWVRSVDKDLVLAGDEAMLYAFDGTGQELWRHPVADGPGASADETRVYQGSARGLAAFER